MNAQRRKGYGFLGTSTGSLLVHWWTRDLSGPFRVSQSILLPRSPGQIFSSGKQTPSTIDQSEKHKNPESSLSDPLSRIPSFPRGPETQPSRTKEEVTREIRVHRRPTPVMCTKCRPTFGFVNLDLNPPGQSSEGVSSTHDSLTDYKDLSPHWWPGPLFQCRPHLIVSHSPQNFPSVI